MLLNVLQKNNKVSSIFIEKFTNFLNSKKGSIVIFIIILLVVLFSYSKVPFLFFQQDEILGFGLFIKKGRNIILDGLGATYIRHFVPITMSISYSIFKFFGMKHWIYNTVGLLFHLMNGFLVYLIAKRIFKNKISRTIAFLIFLSSSVAAELVMWPVINLNSISLSFALISWLVVIDEKILPKIQGYLRGLVIAALFLLAILSVEYSAGFVLFIFAIILTKKKRKKKEKLKLIIPIIIVFFLYSFLRITPILFNQGSTVLSLVKGTPLLIKIFNLVTKYFGQLFLGQSVALFISNIVGKFFTITDKKEVFIENNIFPVVVKLIGTVLILFGLYIYKFLRKKKISYSINFLLVIFLVIFSSFPFLFIPARIGEFSVISSRYMYFGLIGMTMVFSYIYKILIDLRREKESFLFLILIILMIAAGVYGNFKRASYLHAQGKLRLNILNLIKDSYASLPKNVVFYTESDSPYYGLSDNEKILPFQSGFGQTLLVFYSQEEKFPKEFYPGWYLWEITSQGYKEYSERGFGYFRDLDLLKKAVEEYDITVDSVIAFSWRHETQTLLDISDKVRQNISR